MIVHVFSLSKTSVFVRPHVNEKPAFSKISTLETAFHNIVFNAQKGRLPVRVDERLKRTKKVSVFKNIWICVNRA